MKKLTKAERIEVFEAMFADIDRCIKNHSVKQVGECVYCLSCNKRLYQGRLPKEGATK